MKVLLNSFHLNGRLLYILHLVFLFVCKLALVGSFKGNILLNFKFKNLRNKGLFEGKQKNTIMPAILDYDIWFYTRT